MRFQIIIILLPLIFALLIQNTCPHGFAGKSTVARTCSHCPHKKEQKAASGGIAFGSITKTPAHLPMFVLDVLNTQPTFRLAAMAIQQQVIPNSYTNTAPDELLQPPRA